MDTPALDSYLDGIGRHACLDAPTEREWTRKIVELREAAWSSILAAPQAHREVLDAVTAEVRRRLAALEGDRLIEGLTRAGVDPGPVLARIVARGRNLEPAWRTEATAAVAAYHRARNRFAQANLRLVVMFAKRYGLRSTPFVDRVQDGNIGLLEAIDRFDPSRELRFSTYAVWWIRHEIVRASLDHGRVVRIPVHLHATHSRLRRARRELIHALGRDPTELELATAMQMEPSTITRVAEAFDARSVPLSDCDATPDPEELAGRIDHELDERRNANLARLAIRDLPSRQREIVERRFGLGTEREATLQQLGNEGGVSRERVRQIERRALQRVRQALEASRTPSCSFAT